MPKPKKMGTQTSMRICSSFIEIICISANGDYNFVENFSYASNMFLFKARWTRACGNFLSTICLGKELDI